MRVCKASMDKKKWWIPRLRRRTIYDGRGTRLGCACLKISPGSEGVFGGFLLSVGQARSFRTLLSIEFSRKKGRILVLAKVALFQPNFLNSFRLGRRGVAFFRRVFSVFQEIAYPRLEKNKITANFMDFCKYPGFSGIPTKFREFFDGNLNEFQKIFKISKI